MPVCVMTIFVRPSMFSSSTATSVVVGCPSGMPISEGDNTGTWFRTLVIGATSEFMAAAKPASTLHANPYPNTAAPGQGGECEAGNEPYLPGQQIGNVPGNQGTTTEKP